MYDNYNYPPGADTPEAPWNQEDIPEAEFDVFICQTLSKTVTVTTNDYVPVLDEDEEGKYFCKDTSDTDWEDAYYKEHHSPKQLLDIFKRMLKGKLNKNEVPVSDNYLKLLIKECEGWTEDETEILKDE